MKLENTMFSNYQLVVEETTNTPVAVRKDGVICYHLMDRLRVTGDIRGYICPGIKHEGTGTLVEIRRDDTDHFFGVLMDNGEFGYVKWLRIEVIN